MRLLIVLLLVFTTKAGFAQVSGDYKDELLTTVLKDLQQNHNVKVAYDPKAIATVRITASFRNVSVDEALKLILQHTELSLKKVKHNYYTIQPSNVQWNFSGKIKDKEGNPIPYAKVRILNTRKGAYCDDDGNFTLNYTSDTPPVVEVSAFGYKKQQIIASRMQSLDLVELTADVQEYPEIVVEYLTDGVFTGKDVSSLSVQPEKLETVPGTTEPDIFQLVQTVPGINSASATVNEIQIRGGTADQNHLLWDGIPIYQPGHFNGMISSINPNIVDRADLHRGVYNPYFGGRASGLINLHSIQSIPEKITGSAGVNFLQSDLYLAAPVTEKIGVMVSGRRSFINLWRSPTYLQYANRVYQETEIEVTDQNIDPSATDTPEEQFQTSNDFAYTDMNAKVLFQPNEKNKLSVSGIYAVNQLSYSSEFQEENLREQLDNEVRSSSLGFSLNYERIWKERWKTELMGGTSLFEYDFLLTRSEQEQDTILWNDQLTKYNSLSHTQINLSNSYQRNEHNEINFGYQLMMHRVGYEISSTEEANIVSSIGSGDAFINVLHGNYRWNKGKWLANFGARVSLFSSNGGWYPEPRLNLQYQLTEKLTVKSAFGAQNQFVSQVDQLDEIQLGLSNRVWVMADTAEIPVVRSVIGDLGFVYRNRGWLVEVEGYVKQLSDIVSFSDNPAFSSGLLRGDALALGVDVLMKKRWKNFRSWVAYSFSRVDYLFGDFSDEAFVAPFNQPHTFRWGNTLEWRNFEFSAAFKIASGIPYTALDQVVQNPNPDPDAEGYDLFQIEYQKPYSSRFPVFHQLDVTVFYSILNNPDKPWNLKVGASCYNVYNRQNLLSRRYELEFNPDDPVNPEIETFAIDRYFLGITPNAVIRLELQ